MNYEVYYSQRKKLSIQIKPDGKIIVKAPHWMSDAQVEQVVAQKRDWIGKHLPKEREVPRLTDTQIRDLAQKALEKIPERVRYYSDLVGVSYGRITIRNQRTRWGSCSGKGNLNFNCLLMLCPEEVVDYVVVHELCHRKEMNHSAAFWAEVERVLPDYKTAKRWLKDHEQSLIGRME